MSEYHRLSVAEKERAQRDRIREPSIACPHCETRTTVDDLLPHIKDRCMGRRPAHIYSLWIDSAKASELVPRATLRRWVIQRLVLTRGDMRRRRYLKRDIVRLVAKQETPPLTRTPPR